MLCDLITRLRAVLAELQAEGNSELAERVRQAIQDLERANQPPTLADHAASCRADL